MKKESKKTHEAVIAFLDLHPGVHTFGDVAQGLGYTRKTGGQAIGSMMRAIHRRGLHHYCRRVVHDKTGQHGCDAPVENGEQ